MTFLKKNTDFTSGEHVSVISADCYFQGTLNVQGSLRVDGRLSGCVDNARHIVIGVDGAVEGDLSAQTIVVSGSVTGNICADALEVSATAKIKGDIRAEKIAVEEGAVLNGMVVIAPAKEEEK
ncbi:Integral membrane protein CcmA involved in cell shape determination [Elusimicrobium minutum Pei191]|uniref:Integral membrane protein CcmA involved in cell shape determination n=1 Tax=Elusimicrobium minutum (strain Pei191) TaxID=445932 RepID=B2KBQ5_ELUMP|nr:polymer-forming cytoskeletal protein [Elusimicrobium minutum]ACC97742.1 Integral membrane protein CcmA involved in cell shape determination [Elusimicrobium minutum Pei191]